MRYYSFIKDAGADLPEMGEEGENITARASENPKAGKPHKNPAASTKLIERLKEFNLPINNLSLSVEGETVFISGKVKNQDTREKAILAVGNIRGVSKVEEDIKAEEAISETKFHTVEPSETLKIIAEKVYGDPALEHLILEANQPMLTNSETIFTGLVLRIPQP